MFYWIGWIFIFCCILYITNVLSKHTRDILLWILKISMSIYVTCGLMFIVYVSENMDSQKLKNMFETLSTRMKTGL